jgi:hypothetical protein
MCDNKNGCSAAASMMALTAGADEIKAVCGNNTEIASVLTVSNIVRNSGDRLGISADLNYTEFSRIISQVSNITDVKPATDVSSSAVPYSEFNLTENDDAQTVADAVKKLGYDLSEDDNVIYLNTFSKTISPSLRIGYMILPKKLVSVFDERLGFYSCTVPTFEQYVIARLIQNGDFERHINRVRRNLRKKLKL